MLKPNGEKYKIGMAILTTLDRHEYLKITLDTLFASNLADYDVTFLISNDGSESQAVIDLVNQERDPKYKITRYHTPKGHNSWGAAFNKAMNKLLTLGDFDIVGCGDDDAIYHPDWLDNTMKVAIWAKEHNTEDHIGPFSSYNSANFKFHKILAERETPYGKYIVKERMGAVNYFYFIEDFKKLGFFEESKHDETLMTERMKKLNSRNFSTATSYIEHIGNESVLNKWRDTPVKIGDVGLNLAKEGWPIDPYQFRTGPKFYYDSLQEDYEATIKKVNRDNSRPKIVRNVVNFIRLWRQKGINFTKRVLNKLPFGLGDNLMNIYKSIHLFIQQGPSIGWKLSFSRIFVLNKIKKSSKAVNVNYNHPYESDLKIDIYSPMLEKDMMTFPYMLDSIRKHIKHPIGKVFIVSPKSDKLQKLALDLKCEWLDENIVSPMRYDEIGYIVNGHNRSGWLLQQFIKLSADKFAHSDHVFWADTDTIFLRNHVFEYQGKYIFDISDEFHLPYRLIYNKLLQEDFKIPVSFVAHHMIVPTKRLFEMKEKIKLLNGMEWYNAILHNINRNIMTGFAEFETFGHYSYSNYSDQMILEYWSNVMEKYGEIGRVNEFTDLHKSKYKSLSFQNYYR